MFANKHISNFTQALIPPKNQNKVELNISSATTERLDIVNSFKKQPKVSLYMQNHNFPKTNNELCIFFRSK